MVPDLSQVTTRTRTRLARVAVGVNVFVVVVAVDRNLCMTFPRISGHQKSM
jgi:hypothetical protein